MHCLLEILADSQLRAKVPEAVRDLNWRGGQSWLALGDEAYSACLIHSVEEEESMGQEEEREAYWHAGDTFNL